MSTRRAGDSGAAHAAVCAKPESRNSEKKEQAFRHRTLFLIQERSFGNIVAAHDVDFLLLVDFRENGTDIAVHQRLMGLFSSRIVRRCDPSALATLAGEAAQDERYAAVIGAGGAGHIGGQRQLFRLFRCYFECRQLRHFRISRLAVALLVERQNPRIGHQRFAERAFDGFVFTLFVLDDKAVGQDDINAVAGKNETGNFAARRQRYRYRPHAGCEHGSEETLFVRLHDAAHR